MHKFFRMLKYHSRKAWYKGVYKVPSLPKKHQTRKPFVQWKQVQWQHFLLFFVKFQWAKPLGLCKSQVFPSLVSYLFDYAIANVFHMSQPRNLLFAFTVNENYERTGTHARNTSCPAFMPTACLALNRSRFSYHLKDFPYSLKGCVHFSENTVSVEVDRVAAVVFSHQICQ